MNVSSGRQAPPRPAAHAACATLRPRPPSQLLTPPRLLPSAQAHAPLSSLHPDSLYACLHHHHLHHSPLTSTRHCTGAPDPRPHPTPPTHADTPAGMLLHLLGGLLEGQPPDVRDVVFIRSALLRSADLYTPMDLRTQLKGANLDVSGAVWLCVCVKKNTTKRSPRVCVCGCVCVSVCGCGCVWLRLRLRLHCVAAVAVAAAAATGGRDARATAAVGRRRRPPPLFRS